MRTAILQHRIWYNLCTEEWNNIEIDEWNEEYIKQKIIEWYWEWELVQTELNSPHWWEYEVRGWWKIER